MYVFLYVCISVCISVCMYVFLYVCMYVCMYMYTHTHTHTQHTHNTYRQAGPSPLQRQRGNANGHFHCQRFAAGAPPELLHGRLFDRRDHPGARRCEDTETESGYAVPDCMKIFLPCQYFFSMHTRLLHLGRAVALGVHLSVHCVSFE